MQHFNDVGCSVFIKSARHNVQVFIYLDITIIILFVFFPHRSPRVLEIRKACVLQMDKQHCTLFHNNICFNTALPVLKPYDAIDPGNDSLHNRSKPRHEAIKPYHSCDLIHPNGFFLKYYWTFGMIYSCCIVSFPRILSIIFMVSHTTIGVQNNGTLLLTWMVWISAWMGNHMPSKVWCAKLQWLQWWSLEMDEWFHHTI